ncbi:MAG: thiamine diphosphokinase [Bacteroidales bacterium]|nr:thiamine diphosphokinase [Bacteroidales bacterium]
MKEAVILAQGTYPTHPYPLQLLQTAKILICTDGAVNQLQGKIPYKIVGDIDSLSKNLQVKYKSRLIRDLNQENNDLTKAVLYCHKQGIRNITILGATGLREDHTLGNISLLGTYACLMDSVRMVTDHGIFYTFVASKESSGSTGLFTAVSVPCIPGLPVSFFALNPAMKLRAKGVMYPVENVIFDALWKATLNECTEDLLQLEFAHGPLLVFLPLLSGWQTWALRQSY